MQKLEEVAQESVVPRWLTSPAAAYQVRTWIAQGKQQAAARLLQERELPPLALIAQGEAVDDNVIYMRQDECLSQVRLLIAQSNGHPSGPRLEVALTLLERLRHMVEARGLVPKVIELLALRALAHQAQGDIPQAMTALEQALSLAEPEGFVRVFVDEGEPMIRLLRRAAAQGIKSEYVGRLLDAFGSQVSEFQVSGSGATQANLQPGTQARATLAEPLSERELEVLRLLRTHLPSTEIAEALVVSVNTARSHIKNIYSKLDVHSRADAVRRAEELGLL
jgi:LuxR family maltose regulon positive regulatory protein